MIDTNSKLLIKIINATLNDNVNSEELFGDIDAEQINWNSLYALARKHSINNMLYQGILKMPDRLKPNNNIIQAFKKAYKANIIVESNQQMEMESVKKSLEESGFDYMVLKGAVIKQYYPQPHFRSMNDIDILYRGGDIEALKKIMLGCGFKFENSKGKDDIFTKPPLMLMELHRNLIDKRESSYYDYLNGAWDRGVVSTESENDREYFMTHEDFYIYMMIHMAKHFTGGGIGIRFISDAYVFGKKFQGKLNEEYIDKIMEKLGLGTFHKKINKLAGMWFGCEENLQREFENSTEDMEYLEEFVINSGIFGTEEQQIAVSRAQEKQGNKYLFMLGRLFPTYERLCSYYGPWIKGKPYLVPVAWVRLNFSRLFLRGNITKRNLKTMNQVDNAAISKSARLLESLGINK